MDDDFMGTEGEKPENGGDQGGMAQELRSLQEELQRTIATEGNSSPAVGLILTRLGHHVAQMPKLKHEAIMYYRGAIQCYGGPNSSNPQVYDLLLSLAHVLRETNQYTTAKECLQHALQIKLSKYGVNLDNIEATDRTSIFNGTIPIHELTQLGDLCTDIGNTLHSIDDTGQAQLFLERALRLRMLVANIAGDGDRDPMVARGMNNLAALYFDMGRYEEALPLLRNSMSVLKDSPKSTSAALCATMNNLASVLEKLGRCDEALDIMVKALQIERELYGGDHLEVARTTSNYAILLKSVGRTDEARICLENSLSIKMRNLGDLHPEIAKGLYNLAEIYREKGEMKTAFALHKQAYDIKTKIHHQTHHEVGDSLHCLAIVLYEMEDYNTAVDVARQCWEVQCISRGASHPDATLAKYNLQVIERVRDGGDNTEKLMDSFERLSMSSKGRRFIDSEIKAGNGNIADQIRANLSANVVAQATTSAFCTGRAVATAADLNQDFGDMTL